MIFVNNHNGRPYGNAVLWCWLRPEWDIFRIATFYGPIWVAIIATMSIYIFAGNDIYKKRKKMLNFKSTMSQTGGPGNDFFHPAAEFFSYKVTEVVHTTEIVEAPAKGTLKNHQLQAAKEANTSYSVTISADKPPSVHRDSLDMDDHSPPPSAPSNPEGNPNLSTSTTITTGGTNIANLQAMNARRRHFDANNATWSYAKCAILFFCVLLITWIPSSGNRVYSMINDNRVSRPLFFASAFVLPLQGFWNAIICMVTSWGAVKALWLNLAPSISVPFAKGRTSIADITSLGRHRDTRPSGGKWSKAESTSMEDLTPPPRRQSEGSIV